MRIVCFSNSVRHVIVELGIEKIPGIMVDGPITKKGDEVTISNFFLPVVGCDIVPFEGGLSLNGDHFSIATQVGLFNTSQGGLVLAPSDEFNDLALVFFEFLGHEKLMVPKEETPDLLKQVEFDDEVKSDMYMLILKKNIRQSIFSITTSGKILEYTFLYDYLSGEVGFKVKRHE